MIFVDGHVHIYNSFNLEMLLDSASDNIAEAAKSSGKGDQPVTAVLLLAEGKASGWFDDIVQTADLEQHMATSGGRWSISVNDDSLSLCARCTEALPDQLTIIAGSQIVTSEKIEVLALVCNAGITDGLPLKETIATIREHNGIPVIPWGMGKWFGKRGRIVRDFLLKCDAEGIFLGDNGGRPVFWPSPDLFYLAEKKYIPILPGSDPLPLPNEEQRAGSFGFYLDHHAFDMTSPAISMRSLLLGGKQIFHPFGKRQSTVDFFVKQAKLRSPAAK